MPQLQINQGPQDALLYDNTRSYFTNVGYVRTSNFQLELRDVDSQNSATQFGNTVQFVIPKAADLLGPCDLIVELNNADQDPTEGVYAAWVDTLGYAMIDRITFSVGSHDIETITGDQLNIINELMKSDTQRLGAHQLLKTGAPAVYFDPVNAGATSATANIATHAVNKPIVDTSDVSRIIFDTTNKKVTAERKLIVPLGLFFTKHPSQYFPLAAIAGCNDVRVAIKFRTLEELLIMGTSQYSIQGQDNTDATLYTGTANMMDPSVANIGTALKPTFASGPMKSCRLRCHYIHVTGPEATTLMNKEHVRLLKLWQVNTKQVTVPSLTSKDDKICEMDLSFLHPVQELIITIRKVSEMSSSTVGTAIPEDDNQNAITKNYFAYHGGGKDPNPEAIKKRFLNGKIASSIGAPTANDGLGGTDTAVNDSYLTVNDFKLTLNGTERHPSLARSGLDRHYLMNRLMPMLHSNTSTTFADQSDLVVDVPTTTNVHMDFARLAEMTDRKEIYVYPFALNPEGANPSGAVNFSKVSHAKLTISGKSVGDKVPYQVDVYGVHYNWLQIKDGRALTSFA